MDPLGAERFGEVGGANADPLKEYCVVPIPWVPNHQVQGNLPTSKTCMRNPDSLAVLAGAVLLPPQPCQHGAAFQPEGHQPRVFQDMLHHRPVLADQLCDLLPGREKRAWKPSSSPPKPSASGHVSVTHVLALSTELKAGGLGAPHTPPSPRRT